MQHRWWTSAGTLVTLGALTTACTGAPFWPAPTEPAVASVSISPALAGGGTAQAALDGLAVKGRAPKTGYTREAFGQAWSDDVTVGLGHNGCDTRSDILRRDLVDVTLKPGTRDCVPLSGTLHDPYTGGVIAFVRGADTSADVQIDHVVALSDAWQTGAQQLPEDTRRDLANDPLNLLAVDGPSNQAKSDSDAASWLPPQRSYRCAYVSRQVAVKAAYDLWITPAEKDAMAAVLSNCPHEALPTDGDGIIR